MSEQPQTGPGLYRILPTDAELNRMTRIANNAARSGIGGCATAQEAFAKLITGWSIGLDAGTALNNLKLVEGRMTAAEMIKVAAVRRSGIGDVRTVEVTDDHATVAVTRSDWPDGRTELVTFSQADAVRAGLLVLDNGGKNVSRKDNWRKFAPDMLLARARGTALRRWLEEASVGLPYSADELGADTDADGNVVELDTMPGQFSAPVLPTAKTAAPVPDPQPEGVTDPLPVPQGPPQAALPAGGTATDPVAAAIGDIGRETLTKERSEKARMLLTLIRWDTPTWKLFLNHHFGKQRFADLADADQLQAIAQLERLHRCEWLRDECKIDAAAWSRAKAKRGVQEDWQLTGQATQEIVNKLADTLTPFRRQQLGLDVPTTGSLAGNGSTPTAGATQSPAQQMGNSSTETTSAVPSLIPQAAAA